MSNRRLAVLAAVLFAFTVLARAPARWLLAAAPRALECQEPSGSIWHGACTRLQVPGLALAAVSWKLHPWSLATGKLDLDLRCADVRAPARARLALGFGGRLRLSEVHARLPVDSGFLPLFPPDWSGQVELSMDSVSIEQGRLAGLRGTAVARSLAQRHPAMPFGSYELRFGDASGAGAIVGTLRDLDGPLAVSGTLTIRNGHDYELSGLAAARPEATPELAKAVQFLGPADAQGRHAYSLAGSF